VSAAQFMADGGTGIPSNCNGACRPTRLYDRSDDFDW